MKVGFVGLGDMGLAMADNLRRAGHDLTVYNRTRARAEALAGARVAATPGEAAAGAEVVVSMLADDLAVEQVIFGPEGVMRSLAPGAVHAGMSTISHELTRRLAAEHAREGQHYVAAPVFGRPDAARAAKLWIVAAGPSEAVERCRPLFGAMGQGTDVVGDDPVRAAVLKIGGNFLLVAAIEAMGEAFALVRKYGIAPAQLLEIVNGRLLRSPVYENYGKLIAEERFDPPGFRLRHGLKDAKLALAAGEDAAAPLPIASLARDRYLAAMARGWGDLDWAALAWVSALAAGLEEPIANPTDPR
ncbi:MAG TPA: NAD(P)-dependent oxidoreductase [Gemmatimonadales bacterium]|nr:NAD(P)-dependent oxidoreductase [Gemmatimonadales bacterium]